VCISVVMGACLLNGCVPRAISSCSTIPSFSCHVSPSLRMLIWSRLQVQWYIGYIRW
jgi:hypothetical protein